MVLLAYDFEGRVISVVNANSVELAQAFWQGKGLIPNTIKRLDAHQDFIPLSEHPTGVYEIVKTKTVFNREQQHNIVIVEK